MQLRLRARFKKKQEDFISINYLINEEIRANEVRLIREDGAQAGVVSFGEALNFAAAVGMDLVLVSPKDVVPPVCKILNYGQMRYEQNKKDKKAKRHAKATAVVKELKISASISTHDYDVRVNQAKRFLEKGYKVKVLVQFRGREVTHADLGIAMLKRFGEALANLGVVEAPPRLAGFMVHIVLSPAKHHKVAA